MAELRGPAGRGREHVATWGGKAGVCALGALARKPWTGENREKTEADYRQRQFKTGRLHTAIAIMVAWELRPATCAGVVHKLVNNRS